MKSPNKSEFPYILECVNSRPRNHARFAGFREFYPFYLSQHRNPVNRGLHFSGNLIIIALLIAAIVTRFWWLLIAVPVAGYGLAWIGHFFFEHNRPATFTHPLYSLIGDWVAFAQTLTGSRPG
ncbi:MAG: Mpo1-like protein [Gammaproteobacteria bacterium]